MRQWVRIGKLREQTADLLIQLEEELEVKRKEVEALEKEIKMLRAKLDEERR